MKNLAIMMILPVLMACDGIQTAAPATPDAGSDTCGASGYSSLIGQNFAAVTLPVGTDLRVINPGDMVTMDYRATRVNFELDAGGLITVVRCG